MLTNSELMDMGRKYLLLIMVGIMFAICAMLNFNTHGEQQFAFLSESFINGKTYFLEIPGSKGDVVYWRGKYYWPLSPVPAIVLTPLVVIYKAMGKEFYQGYVQFFTTGGIFLVSYCLARKKGFSQIDAAFLAYLLCFASVFQMVAMYSWSWYFVQALCMFFGLLAIYEWETKKRIWVIGILMATVFATRVTAGIGIVFFGLAILLTKESWKGKLSKLIILFLPMLIAGLGLLEYNFLRFQNPLNNGYAMTNNSTLSEQDRYELLKHGLFKIENIPTNLYYYFVKTVDPVRENAQSLFGNTPFLKWPFVKVEYPGTSVFVVSPVFLWMFSGWFKRKDKEIKLAWVTMGLILIVLLTYYWSGWRQVGPRYLIDLLPFAFFVLLRSFDDNKLSKKVKTLIFGSSVFDLFLLITVFFRFLD